MHGSSLGPLRAKAAGAGAHVRRAGKFQVDDTSEASDGAGLRRPQNAVISASERRFCDGTSFPAAARAGSLPHSRDALGVLHAGLVPTQQAPPTTLVETMAPRLVESSRPRGALEKAPDESRKGMTNF